VREVYDALTAFTQDLPHLESVNVSYTRFQCISQSRLPEFPNTAITSTSARNLNPLMPQSGGVIRRHRNAGGLPNEYALVASSARFDGRTRARRLKFERGRPIPFGLQRTDSEVFLDYSPCSWHEACLGA
jgi:hypothetical protein